MNKTQAALVSMIFALIISTTAVIGLVNLYNDRSESDKTEVVEVIININQPAEVKATRTIEVIVPQEIGPEFNILSQCGYTQDQLENAMQGDYYKKMLPYVDTIMKAEEDYGVNAMYLLCKLGLESGWGKYESAKNNIGGWRCDNGKFKEFESVETCIMHIAETLASEYRETVGTKLADVCYRYCQDDGYCEALMQIMNECEQRIS